MDTARGATPVTNPPESVTTRDGIADSDVYDLRSHDTYPLTGEQGMDDDTQDQITELLAAFGALRDAERLLNEASRRYMQLNDTDMRALRYLIVCARRGAIATPGGIAQHLRISTASTTKLLDRLERGGHIERHPHPHDRRALAIRITTETHRAARETVGRSHARRVIAAARLSPAEREVVTRFLRDMTAEISPEQSSGAHAPVEREE